MANKGYRILSSLGEALAGKDRNILDNMLHAMKPGHISKFESALGKNLKPLAESRRFVNRGINVLDDLKSSAVAPSALAGAGIGGAAGFLGAPGTESENLMGKTTYKGPGLAGRLSAGLTGAFLGGGLGAGYGLHKLDNLAKTVAKGGDLPPGVLSQFLEGITSREKRDLYRNAVGAVDPNLLNKSVAKGKVKNVGQNITKDYMHPLNIKDRALKLQTQLANLADEVRNSPYRHTALSLHNQELLNRLVGKNIDVNKLSPAEIEAAAMNLARRAPNQIRAIEALLDVNNRNAVANTLQTQLDNMYKLREQGLRSMLTTPLGMLGTYAGGAPGGALGLGVGAIAPKILNAFTKEYGRLPTKLEARALNKLLDTNQLVNIAKKGKNVTKVKSLEDLYNDLGLGGISPDILAQLGKPREGLLRHKFTAEEAGAELLRKLRGLGLLGAGTLATGGLASAMIPSSANNNKK